MSDVIELEALDQPTFTQVGHWLIFRHDISPTARHLYTVLAAFVHQGRRNTGDTEVWPSLNLLAVILGLSKGESVTPYLDELIQADVIRKRSTTIGGMKARNTYAIRFNPPPGTPAANGLGDLLAPLKEIASDPKAMSRAAKEVRATINERREREKQARTGQSGETAGRAVPRKSGVRTPESRGTYPRKPGWNNTKVEQDEGLPLLPARAEAAAPPRPRRSEEEEKNNTKGQRNTPSDQQRCTTCTMVDQRKCTTCTKGAETPETRAIRVVLDRLADHSPTEDEARAVITHIRNQATQRGTTIARIDRWVDGRDTGALAADLDHMRAQTKARRRPSEGTCRIHGDKRLPCIYCRMSAHAGDWTDLITELQRAGAEGRPDLDALVREYGVEHLLAA